MLSAVVLLRAILNLLLSASPQLPTLSNTLSGCTAGRYLETYYSRPHLVSPSLSAVELQGDIHLLGRRSQSLWVRLLNISNRVLQV